MRACVHALVILSFYITGGTDFASSVIGSSITFSPWSLSLTSYSQPSSSSHIVPECKKASQCSYSGWSLWLLLFVCTKQHMQPSAQHNTAGKAVLDKMITLYVWLSASYYSAQKDHFYYLFYIYYIEFDGFSSYLPVCLQSWLRKYGYLPQASRQMSTMRSAQILSSAVSDMQRFYGLEVTGQMDPQTIRSVELNRAVFEH